MTSLNNVSLTLMVNGWAHALEIPVQATLAAPAHRRAGRAQTGPSGQTGAVPRADVRRSGVPGRNHLHPDFRVSALGARGAGEIGIVGTAAAVANASYHATGKRSRETPITLDKLL